MATPKKIWARPILALLVAIAAVWLSVRQVDWPRLGEALADVQLGFLGLALLAVLATTAIKAARWQVMLRPCIPHIPLARTLRVLLIGQMANSLLPRLGDLARALLLGPQAQGGIPAVLGTILAEKALDGVMGLLLLLALALMTPLPTWLRGPLLGLATLTAGLILALVWAGRQPSAPGRILARILSALPAGLGGRLERLAAGLGLGLGLFRQPGRALVALALSAAIWGLAALTNILTLAA
ncbi:MAG: lysylphosphatidylglycerol synthase transmembrane domain-containing protein, partial [Anaerolineae bacterium]